MRAEARRDYEAGQPVGRIAARLGISTAAVRDWADAEVWARPDGWEYADAARLLLTDEQKAAFGEQWTGNWTTLEMALHWDVSPVTVCRTAKRLGLSARDQGAVQRRQNGTEDRHRRLITMWNDGIPTLIIAETMGMTEPSVRRVVSRARRAGLVVADRCRGWVPTDEDVAVLRIGYRLGVSVPALVPLVSAAHAAQLHQANATLLRLRHRNASRPIFRLLAADALLWVAEQGGDVRDTVQAVYRRALSFTEREAMLVLEHFVDASELLPGLAGRRGPPSRLWFKQPDRPPSDAVSTYSLTGPASERAFFLPV